jgi:hypothetical protein
MNRRLFMKSVGLAAIAGISLSSCKPKPRVSAGSPYPNCPCPSCQAGIPTKELHWVVLEPGIVFLNDKPITVRVTNA